MSTVTITPIQPVISNEDFLQRFGDWIEGLFNEAKHIYNKLSDDEKRAAVWGSGIIAIVNQAVDQAPPAVVTLIQAAFPDLSVDTVHGFIDEVLNTLNAVQGEIPLTLEDAIAELQAYLKSHGGSTWAVISAAAAKLFTILFAPETLVQKIEQIGEYVYQLIVRPHVTAVVASTPVSSTPAKTTTTPAETTPTEPVTPPVNETVPPVAIDPSLSAANAGSPAPGNVPNPAPVAENTPTENEENIQAAVNTGIIDDVSSEVDGTPTQKQIDAVEENAENGGAKTADELGEADENGNKGAAVDYNTAMKAQAQAGATGANPTSN